MQSKSPAALLFLVIVTTLAPAEAQHKNDPIIRYRSPSNGAEVKPSSTVVIKAEISDPQGIKAAFLYWSKTGNDLRCPGRGSNWRCSIAQDTTTYQWEVDLGREEGVRHYHVKAEDLGGHKAVGVDRQIRVTANPSGMSLALVTPLPGTVLQAGQSFEILAQAQSSASAVSSVRVRLEGPQVGLGMIQDEGDPSFWRLVGFVDKNPAMTEVAITLEAVSLDGAVATAGPFRLRIQGTVAQGGFPVHRFHTTRPVLMNDRADAVLAHFNQLLARDDDQAGYDVACVLEPVPARRGDVQTFTFGDGSLDTAAELREVLDRPGGGAYVVNEINYCGGTARPTTIGCAGSNGAMAVERLESVEEEGVLWAHEFGHVAGLGHVLKSDYALNLMNKGLRTDKTRVRTSQCEALQRQARDDWAPDEVSTADLQLEETDSAVEDLPIEEFIRERFIEGVPFELAARYSSDSVPLLIKELRKPSPGVRLSVVVIVLGAIGDQRAVLPLIEFAEAGTGQLSAEAYDAKKGAVFALGLLLNRNPSRESLDYLTLGLSPNHWQKEIKWRLPYEASAEIRNWQMVKIAASALGVSGNAAAAESLRSQSKRMLDATGIVPQDVIEVFREAVKANEAVRTLGLSKYFLQEF